MITNNPFTVTTPEDMQAKDVVDLFVDVFSDFPKIINAGHIFLHGPRGSGKSMMFRYLQPDCQMISHSVELNKLPFFSIYVSVKNTDLKVTELEIIEDKHASSLLNEHFMVSFLLQVVLKSLSYAVQKSAPSADIIYEFAKKSFLPRLADSGEKIMLECIEKKTSAIDCTTEMIFAAERIYKQFLQYLKRLFIPGTSPTYTGPLFGYLDFLFPLLEDIANLPFMPKGPIFLLIDDADNLNLTQTKVLNSWVASRTSSKVSLKISTQMQYKTYYTVTGHQIDYPHDFSEINISTLYTSSKTKYLERLAQIVCKRLNLKGLATSPEDFFPFNIEQENEIQKIADGYRKSWEATGRGNRPSDDATRYARPDYFKKLAGFHKSSYTYSYSGFNQLVHISSGVIRYFLENAAIMYSETAAKFGENITVNFIPPEIQNKVVRDQADALLFNEFSKIKQDQSDLLPERIVLDRLYNLITGLGGTFRQILLSDRSERRVFSIAFSSEISQETEKILNLGIQLGYFHCSAIGNKEGTRRIPLFVLTRRLAPHFNLDPTSFAGYLFVTENQIKELMQKPDTVLRKIRNEGVDKVFETIQLNLFE